MEEGLISVDRWEEQSEAYFLSHLHSDHTRGLSGRWKRGPLYCSPISSLLLPSFFPTLNPSLIHALQIGVPHSLSLLSPSTSSPIRLQVTPIEALHCPGAVMYLFQGEFGSMLYTGDFRWEPNSDKTEIAKSHILNALGDHNLDFLYLDNTYCNPLFNFPCREIVARKVVKIIATHPDHDIIIGLNNLGKEELLVYISQALRIKIWVWPERLKIMQLLGLYDIVTTRTTDTRVRAVPRYSLTIKNLKDLNKLRPTIGVMPSGLPWVRPGVKDNSLGSEIVFSPRSKGRTKRRNPVDLGQLVSSSSRVLHQCLYLVPYSDHSCFAEIRDFLRCIKPSSVRGIVSSSVFDVNPLHCLHELSEDVQDNRQAGCSDSVEVIQSGATSRHGNSNIATGRKKSNKATCLGVRNSWVNFLRGKNVGAKIAEEESVS